MAVWQWFAFDLRTRQLIGEVPVRQWSSTARLSDSGEWSASLRPPSSSAEGSLIESATAPARTVLVGCRDGEVVDAGIVWRRRRGEIAGSSLLSYLDRRVLLADCDYVDVDVFDVARDLVEWQQLNGGVSIDVVATPASGTQVDQSWRRWDAKNIGEAIRQLASSRPGFEISQRCVLDTSVGAPGRPSLVWELRLDLRTGRPWPSSAVRFEHGVNAAVDLAADEDGASAVTRSTGVGAELDSVTQERRVSTVDASDLLAAGWPALDGVVTASDVRGAFRLAALARGALATEITKDRTAAAVLPDHPLAPWRSWTLGDDALLVVPAGVDEWIPDGSSAVRRVVETAWSVTESSEDLTVTFAPLWTAS